LQLNKALTSFEAIDPNVERFTKVGRIIQDAVRCYRGIYEEKMKQNVQTKLSMFLSKENITYLNPRK
jgi:hypothetical protein